MFTRRLARLAGAVTGAAALSLALPLPAANANYCVEELDTFEDYGVVLRVGACLDNFLIAGRVVDSLQGWGYADFYSDPASFGNVLSCSTDVTVYDADSGSTVTTYTTDCTNAATSNGNQKAYAMPTDLVGLPVCGLGHHYYSTSKTEIRMWDGWSLNTGVPRSYTVYC